MVGIVCLVLSLCLLRESCSVGFLFVFFLFPLCVHAFMLFVGALTPPSHPAVLQPCTCLFFILQVFYPILYQVFCFLLFLSLRFWIFFFVSRYFFFCSFWVFLPKFGSQVLVRLHYFYRIKDLRVGSSCLLGEVV